MASKPRLVNHPDFQTASADLNPVRVWCALVSERLELPPTEWFAGSRPQPQDLGYPLVSLHTMCYRDDEVPIPSIIPTSSPMPILPDRNNRRPAVRPPLKWAGGKRWQVPHLISLWKARAHRRLVEPFCGGLAVTLGLMPDRAVLNDINPHVINFYRWLKRGLRVSLKMKNDGKAYYAARVRFNEILGGGGADTAEAAQLFYYLNRTGYNGLCRFNQKGGFNVPFGRYAKIGYAEDFDDYKSVFSEWDFTHTDFDRLDLDPGDFVYADPPYDVEFTSVLERGLHLGRPGAHGRMVGQAPWPRRPLESSDQTHREAVSEAWIQAAVPGRAADDQLHRRSDPCQRGARAP